MTHLILSFLLAGFASASVKTGTVELKDLVLDKNYQSMAGPSKNEFVQVETGGQSHVWLLSEKVQIFDGKRVAPEYLCHSRLGVAPLTMDISHLNTIQTDADLGIFSLLAISQGLDEIQFPEGYGLRVFVPPGKKSLLFGAQVQNPVRAITHPIHLRIEAKFKYLTDKEASGLKRLHGLRFSISSHHHHVPGSSAHGHFVVPVGESVQTQDLEKEDFREFPQRVVIHYMRMHLHAYATSMELFDKTTGKTVWKGNAHTDSELGSLTHTDFYSSKTGLPFFRDHKYQVIAKFNNTSGKEGEGMAIISAFYAIE